MALISRYRCSGCDIELPDGEDGGFYVRCTDGSRKLMGPDPQPDVVEQETGLEYWAAYHKGMVGEIHPCICMDCARQVTLDLERDIKQCRHCGGLDMRTLHGAVGCTCPGCKAGIIESEAFAVS